MTVVWVIAAVMLTAATVATMFRLLAGPSTLDRLVALDTLVAVTMCAIGTWAAFSLDTTVTYGLTALALISFVGSVSVARFRVLDTHEPPYREVTLNTLDVVTSVLVLGGSTFALTAAIGIVRFPDTLMRMHAASKPQVLGLLLVLAGAAIRLRGQPRRRHGHSHRIVHSDHRAGGGQPRRTARVSGTMHSRRIC